MLADGLDLQFRRQRVEILHSELAYPLIDSVLRELAYYRLTLAAHLGLSQLSILHLELVGLPVDYRLPNLTREEKRSKGSHHSFRDSQGRKITIPKKGGQKVKGIYVQQIVELLNLEELSDDDTESEEQAD